jgi:hypothetical protein
MPIALVTNTQKHSDFTFLSKKEFRVFLSPFAFVGIAATRKPAKNAFDSRIKKP